MLLHAPAAVGDVLDRITILLIKVERITGPRRDNVQKELDALVGAWVDAGLPPVEVVPETAGLSRVNRLLWDVEDRLRGYEAAGEFGTDFITDARSVYRINDERAALKRAVNDRFGSALREEKQHPRYA